MPKASIPELTGHDAFVFQNGSTMLHSPSLAPWDCPRRRSRRSPSAPPETGIGLGLGSKICHEECACGLLNEANEAN